MLHICWALCLETDFNILLITFSKNPLIYLQKQNPLTVLEYEKGNGKFSLVFDLCLCRQNLEMSLNSLLFFVILILCAGTQVTMYLCCIEYLHKDQR